MTILGWDQSHYDSIPDMARAYADGIRFMTHKAGGDANDAELGPWWKVAKPYRDRMLLGAYWVQYPGDPRTRADRFIARLDDQCPGWRDGPFILQTDCEIWGGDRSTLPGKSDIAAFCDRLRERMPKLRPIVYAPKWAYGNSLAGLAYPLWASAYVNGAGSAVGLYPGDGSSKWGAYSSQTPAILQYTSSATIAGQTTCDANAFRGTLTELTALLAPGWATTLDKETFMAGLTDDQQEDLLKRVKRTHTMIRNLESLVYAMMRGQEIRPEWQDAEVAFTFPATPISPNVALGRLLGTEGVSEAELRDIVANAVPTADANAQAMLTAIGQDDMTEAARMLGAVLTPSQRAQLARLLAG